MTGFAAFGAKLVIAPCSAEQVWPLVADLDLALHAPQSAEGGGDSGFVFSLDLGDEDIEATCGEVDAACDAADGGDGGGD